MTIKFNVNFDFQMSRGELREIGNIMRTMRNDRRDNAKPDERATEPRHNEKRSQLDRAPQRERGTEPRPQISEKCVERSKKERQLADLMKQVEELKKQLNK